MLDNTGLLKGIPSWERRRDLAGAEIKPVYAIFIASLVKIRTVLDSNLPTPLST